MKIAIVASEGRSLRNFRGELIKEWIRMGHQVTAVSIEPKEHMEPSIRELGASYVCVSGDRTGTNPWKDIRMAMGYLRFFKREKPDACFLYMSKPIAYGGIAARIRRVKRRYSMISGLEIAFYKNDRKNQWIRRVLTLLYRIALKGADKVFFQNPDDRERFCRLGIVTRAQSVLVHGSGVDRTYFAPQPMPEEGDTILMIGRLVRYKGIYDFVEAAKLVKKKHSRVRFQVLGGIDTNSDAMPQSEVDELVRQSVIEYLGFQEDVRPALKKCTIFVLPSRFEGVPRSTLEAMAVGRPIITTNAPGCRETVRDGYNGYLVECGDIASLADRMNRLIEDHRLRDQMGEHSRRYCAKRFDVRSVNHAILSEMEML